MILSPVVRFAKCGASCRAFFVFVKGHRMGFLTAGRLQAIIQIIAVVVGLWTGGDATQGLKVLQSRPAGVVGADAEEKANVAGNGLISVLSLLTAANAKRLAEWITKTSGSKRVGAAALLFDIGLLHELRDRANSAEQRASIRDTAIDLVSNTLFPSDDARKENPL